MLTPKQFELLKKKNISVDAEKTKARVTATFKTTTKTQRDEILTLSGLSTQNTFYATEKSGVVSAKAVLALAQVLEISPYYLTGESDDKTFDASMLNKFYKKCPKSKDEKQVQKTKKAVPVETAEILKTETAPVVVPEAPPKSSKVNETAPTKTAANIKIDDSSLIKLLEALAIRAKFGGEAEETYNKVVELLVK